jgi:hypothetical protein
MMLEVGLLLNSTLILGHLLLAHTEDLIPNWLSGKQRSLYNRMALGCVSPA